LFEVHHSFDITSQLNEFFKTTPSSLTFSIFVYFNYQQKYKKNWQSTKISGNQDTINAMQC